VSAGAKWKRKLLSERPAGETGDHREPEKQSQYLYVGDGQTGVHHLGLGCGRDKKGGRALQKEGVLKEGEALVMM